MLLRFEELEDRTLPSGGYPYVQSINRTNPASAVTNGTSVTFTVTFSEVVTGVAASDFQLALGGTATGTVSQVTPVNGSVYTVSVSGVSGNGTLGLNLVDNGSIHDAAGNPLTQLNAPAAFQLPQTFSVSGIPQSLALGDVNGDGIPDLAIPGSVLLGNGNGTFQTQPAISTGIAGPLAMGDVNGDGKLDLVSTGSVLLGNGNGTFQTPSGFFSGGLDPKAVALGDVNGDGKLDVAVANNVYGGTVTLLLGNGNGTFRAGQTIAVGPNPYAVALADINGDGKADLIVGDTSAGGSLVNVLLGNGNGTFQAPQPIASSPDLLGIAVADVNGDGIPDLIIANGIPNSVDVLLGNGNGTFGAPQTFAAGSHPYAVAIGDVNGDGRPDLVVANKASFTVSVLLNSGNGNFTGQVYTLTTATTNLAFSGLPATTTAGSSFGFTLSALDSSNHVVPSYTGTVHFTMSDTGAGSVVPADYTFTPADGGVHVFTAGAILVSLGNQTITATDAAQNALSGSAVVSVLPVAATHFAVFAATPFKPNVAFNFMVTALDQFGNTAQGYTGTVGFSSSDPQALLPANATLTNGVGTFNATLITPGQQTVTATDSTNAAITGSAVVDAFNPVGIAPFVQSINRTNPAGPVTNAGTVVFTVTFSQPVIGVNLTDFALVFTGTTAGTLTQVAPVSGAVYTVTASGITGTGTLGLNLVDNGSITNLAGNPLTHPNAPAEFAVNAALTFATGPVPLAVVAADVNGDGKPDLVVANSNGNTVSVLLGNGNGTFHAQETLLAGAKPVALAVADVSGDSKPDIVVANDLSNTLSVLLGNGNGTFQAQQTFATGKGPTSVAVGDVNGDGKPDIVVANYNGNTVSVLLGNGNGTFQAQQTFATGTYPVAVKFADVNGDGKPDIVVANNLSSTVSVLLGNGNGTFQAQQTFPCGAYPQSLAIGDVNGDGKADLALTNNSSGTVSVLLGNGNGTFQASRFFATNLGTNSVELGDVNGDGKPDLVVANFGNNTVSVLLGNGNGTFQAQQMFAAGFGPSAVALGDVNGDGKLDLAIADEDSDTVNVLLGNGDGTFQTQKSIPTGAGPVAVVAGDFNGDGKTDLAIANYESDSVSVLLGNGNGTFQAQQTYTTGLRPQALAVADVNGDGKPDLVVADFLGSTVSVLLGNGNGTFQAQETFATGAYPQALAVGDVSGDGNPDIVVANYSGNSVSVLLGNGNGTFQTQHTFATGGGPFSVAIGDVNGDGNPDLVVANYHSNSQGVGTVSVLLGNGNGTFQAQTTFAAGPEPHWVAMGDVNGDGNADLVVADEGGGVVSVLLGNGNGTFQTPRIFVAGAFPDSVVLADVNGDGKPDLVVANGAGTSSLSILLGNGNGTFQTQQTFAAGGYTGAVAVADVNGDGRPDLVFANYSSNSVSVLLNSANGNFTGQTYTIISAAAAAQFLVSATPATIPAGSPASLTVIAQDQVGETSRAYTGTVHFSTTDVGIGVSLPSDYTFVPGDNGVHVFTGALTMVTLGSQTVTVTDTTTGSITGNTVVTVTAPVANHFMVTAASTAVAGMAIIVTVTAETTFGNTATNYTGTVQFTCSAATALLPPSATLTAGVGVFSVIPITAGTQTITATDTANSSLTGTSGNITVSAAAANHFAVSAPSSVSAAIPFTFTVTAEDPFDNPAIYAATLRFTSSDQSAVLPANATLIGGSGTFSATLNTFGSQSIAVFDAAAITVTGRTSTITVTAPATDFAISAHHQHHGGERFDLHGDGQGCAGQHRHGLFRHGAHQQQRCPGQFVGRRHLDGRRRLLRRRVADRGLSDIDRHRHDQRRPERHQRGDHCQRRCRQSSSGFGPRRRHYWQRRELHCHRQGSLQ